jgi:hypothetical protein
MIEKIEMLKWAAIVVAIILVVLVVLHFAGDRIHIGRAPNPYPARAWSCGYDSCYEVRPSDIPSAGYKSLEDCQRAIDRMGGKCPRRASSCLRKTGSDGRDMSTCQPVLYGVVGDRDANGEMIYGSCNKVYDAGCGTYYCLGDGTCSSATDGNGKYKSLEDCKAACKPNSASSCVRKTGSDGKDLSMCQPAQGKIGTRDANGEMIYGSCSEVYYDAGCGTYDCLGDGTCYPVMGENTGFGKYKSLTECKSKCAK